MHTIWIGPRVRAFMDEICKELFTGHEHCALVLPERYHDSFLIAFRKYVQNTTSSLHILNLMPGCALLPSLVPAFCDDEIAVNQPWQLLEAHTRQNAVPVLAIPATYHDNELGDFVCSLRDGANAALSRGEALNWRMLFVITPNYNFPNEAPGLRYFHWWGKLHPSDLEFAIEGESLRRGLGIAAHSWFYSLCRGLCEIALELVSPIFEQAPTTFSEVLDILTEHPLSTGSSAAIVLNHMNQPAVAVSRNKLPPAELTRAWQAGLLDMGCHGRLQIHPAALLAAGMTDAIGALIHSGQLQVYFPYVQEVLHLLHHRLDNTLGSGWKQKVEGNPDEIGALQFFVYNERKKNCHIYEEADLAFIWWNIRNRLAHHTMLDAREVMKGLALYETMRY